MAIVIGELELPSLNSIWDLVDDDDDDLAQDYGGCDDGDYYHYFCMLVISTVMMMMLTMREMLFAVLFWINKHSELS